MAEQDVKAREAARRVVAIVPHTHWDRECSGVHLYQRSPT
jgi:hypothetical protein